MRLLCVSALSFHNDPGPGARQSLGQQSGSFRKQMPLIQPAWLSSRIMLQWAAEAPGVMGEAGGEAPESQGSLLASLAARSSTVHRSKAGPKPAWGLGPDLASCLQEGYPQCPALLTGHQENRVGPWNFSSISLKKSGIPTLISLDL